ncbi:hypothetical protein MRX96_023367 [Rhipicephalus microplus]
MLQTFSKPLWSTNRSTIAAVDKLAHFVLSLQLRGSLDSGARVATLTFDGEAGGCREQEFHFDDFIKRFANPKVVIAYCKLLSHYRTNPPATNQHVLRMLHRLAWDLKMYPMLFQASVFKTFQSIMHDCCSLPKERVDGTLKELSRLAKFVVRKFVAAAQENKIAFAELLFWKNTKDAYELVHGYGSGSKKPSKVAWTEEQVYELKVLYERYKEEMTPDKDVVDLILEHMIDDSRTRRSVLLQLKHLGLVDNVKAFTKKAKANAPWNDIMGQIIEHLSVKRPRHRVVDKLLEIGLVCNRVELRKKRARTGGRGGGRQQRGSDDSGSSSDDDNDERIYGKSLDRLASHVHVASEINPGFAGANRGDFEALLVLLQLVLKVSHSLSTAASCTT